VLVEEDGTVISDHGAVVEYLDEAYPDMPLVGRTLSARAEARRLAAWFDEKFYWEVTHLLAGQKLVQRVSTNAAPDSRALREGRENLQGHLQYITWLKERRSWLAGDDLSIADLAAAANISLVDYSGDVPWDQFPEAKEWYVRMKSRPAFRPLLKDIVPGIQPAPIYADLDF
jgi:glutathione S-transferase